MKRFLRFMVVGGIGFMVDAGATLGLLATGLFGPFSARAVAIALALSCTWFCNRNFTFGKSGRHVLREGVLYGSVGITSALLNYAIYSALLISFPMLRPIFALVLASAGATLYSYFGYARFVFHRRH
ncbi:GtrA family protein [Neorhizobium sp. NPDC001467]|uniref:GtrA family protein n=1 Tax=Neorhizobium sp. NPDC001467 TaxID=3390595 RepID=UPI003D04EDD4